MPQLIVLSDARTDVLELHWKTEKIDSWASARKSLIRLINGNPYFLKASQVVVVQAHGRS